MQMPFLACLRGKGKGFGQVLQRRITHRFRDEGTAGMAASQKPHERVVVLYHNSVPPFSRKTIVRSRYILFVVFLG
jgi:hypothetical protein